MNTNFVKTAQRLSGHQHFHILVIAAFALLAYFNTFFAPFMGDEFRFLLNNPFVTGAGEFRSLRGMETEVYNHVFQRITGYISFAVNYRIHGGHVLGYHIVNIAIHIINGMLLYFLVVLTFHTPFLKNTFLAERAYLVAFWASLLFISHPVQTEAVTYVYQRLASLATLFYLLSLLCYARWRISFESSGTLLKPYALDSRRRPFFWYTGSVLAAVAAMKTKEIAFTLPFLAAIYEFSFFSGDIKRRLLRLTPLLSTAAIIPITILIIIQKTGSSIDEITRAAGKISSHDYIITQLRVVVTYLRLLIFPVNQQLLYDYLPSRSLTEPSVIASGLLLAAVFACVGYLYSRSRKEGTPARIAGFGIAWFFLTLSVESLVANSNIIHEYRLYLPSGGIFIAVAVAANSLLMRKVSRNGMMVLLLLLAIPLNVATYERNSIWSDSVTFWEDAVRKNPFSFSAHHNLGNAYLELGWNDEADREHLTAVKLNPSYYIGLAERYFEDGRVDESKNIFQQVALAAPYALDASGIREDFAQAIDNNRRAALRKPDDQDIHYNLAELYRETGQYRLAVHECQETLNLAPDHAGAHAELGEIYAELGMYSEAKVEFISLLKLNPTLTDERRKLLAVIEQLRRRTERSQK